MAAGEPAIFSACLTKPLRQAQLYECLTRIMGWAGELAEAIVASFLASLPAQLDQLAANITAGHSDLAEQQAHKIRGAAATMEAVALRQIAAVMETAGKAGDLEQLGQLLPQLRRQFELLQAKLNELWPC